MLEIKIPNFRNSFAPSYSPLFLPRSYHSQWLVYDMLTLK